MWKPRSDSWKGGKKDDGEHQQEEERQCIPRDAEDVNFDADKNFIFLYDGEEHKAKLATSRLNSMVRFEFFDDEDDPSTLEFRLTRNDFTQTLFVQVIEYAEIYDEDEQEELWEGLMCDLRATIGS